MIANLTAAELHALYAPLWERVPETRPRLTEDQVGAAFSLVYQDDWVNWPFVWRRDSDGLIEDINEVDPGTSAALCRVAAEDWLLEKLRPNGFGIAVPVREDDAFAIETCVLSEHPRGPTIHHALVAACIAVAETQKWATV